MPRLSYDAGYSSGRNRELQQNPRITPHNLQKIVYLDFSPSFVPLGAKFLKFSFKSSFVGLFEPSLSHPSQHVRMKIG